MQLRGRSPSAFWAAFFTFAVQRARSHSDLGSPVMFWILLARLGVDAVGIARLWVNSRAFGLGKGDASAAAQWLMCETIHAA